MDAITLDCTAAVIATDVSLILSQGKLRRYILNKKKWETITVSAWSRKFLYSNLFIIFHFLLYYFELLCYKAPLWKIVFRYDVVT